MMLEELSKAYYSAYWGIDTTNNNERDIAGIRAAVAHLQEWMVVQASNADDFDVDDLHGLFQLVLWSNAKPRPITWVGGEAVPGGASCHSAEHAMPETASKGEQRD